ncbi:hypothetical protein C7441_108109 [Pseudaminobacter salicylatoxidans]|uniref:Acid shock protein n=1 Tax=Pseudaminobacter salicylatoxidans TaxID=93369 RepID=A0A316C418_PSESE|nr:hypothetical protein [Pseudaminobacter salicylatoxidans]PWJ83716.1 hypothetical protein C7441_108109 [Pseudaminobacter salicylatoxidans]
MTLSKSLMSALGLTVALAFSAPMFAATANAAGTTTTYSSPTENTNAPVKKMNKNVHHKKTTHKKHHKKAAPKKEENKSAM